MKTLTLALLFISTFSAQAVVTKNCPDKVTFKIVDLQNHQVADDNYNTLGIIELQRELSQRKFISAELELRYAGNAECSYRGEDNLGNYTSAKLSGSIRPNAKEPAVLKVLSSNLAVYINIAQVKPTGLRSQGEQVSLYYRGEYCSWGDCIPDHIQVGVAKLDTAE